GAAPARPPARLKNKSPRSRSGSVSRMVAELWRRGPFSTMKRVFRVGDKSIPSGPISRGAGRRRAIMITRRRILALAAKLKAVGDRKEDGFDARVASQLPVEGVEGAAVRVLDRFGGKSSAPEHVVEENQSVQADAWEEEFVVGVVF